MTWRRAGADAGHNHSAAPLPQRRVRAVLPPALTASLDTGRDGRAQEYKNVKQLVATRAVITIWSPTSVRSDWVRAEAGRAKADGKLIPLTTPEFVCLPKI